MTVSKPTVTVNKRPSRTLELVARITCLELEGADKFNKLNKTLADNALARVESEGEMLSSGRSGTVVALLEPTVTYIDSDIISAKYDFTVTQNGELVFHRRFCISYLLDYELFLLPSFVRGLGRRVSANAFYLTRLDGGIGAVRLRRVGLEPGTRLARRSQIDAGVDLTAKPVKIKLPRYLDRVARKKK